MSWVLIVSIALIINGLSVGSVIKQEVKSEEECQRLYKILQKTYTSVKGVCIYLDVSKEKK